MVTRLLTSRSTRRTRAALEALLGSAGILLAGVVTIPAAAWAVGATINLQQGASMSVLFFFGRWIYLFALRMWFQAKEDMNNG